MSFVGRLSRSLRPLALVAMGVLVGAGAAPVAAAVHPAAGKASLQTRVFSCSAYDFSPLDSNTTYQIINRTELWQRYQSTGDGFFSCNAVLPTRAVVTRVAFTYTDDSESYDLRYCSLQRIDLAAAQVTNYQTMAQIPRSTFEGPTRVGTSRVSYATIDNSKFGYELQCQFTGSSQNLGLFGASVWYLISPANG